MDATNAMSPSRRLRWMVRRDFRDVLDIETWSFAFPWSEEDFSQSLRSRNCIGMVLAENDETVGFMIYELVKTRVRLLKLAVAPACRRRSAVKNLTMRFVGTNTPSATRCMTYAASSAWSTPCTTAVAWNRHA